LVAAEVGDWKNAITMMNDPRARDIINATDAVLSLFCGTLSWLQMGLALIQFNYTVLRHCASAATDVNVIRSLLNIDGILVNDDVVISLPAAIRVDNISQADV
jgi:hypothetical protein